MKRIMLATGQLELDDILKKHLQDHWEISDITVDLREHLLRKIEMANPDILIIHDKLMSNYETKEESDQEWIELIEQIRFQTSDIRLVFIGVRDDDDGFLLELINLGVLDIFITNTIDPDTLINQLLENPTYKNISYLRNRLKHGIVEAAPLKDGELASEESEEETEKEERVSSKQRKPVIKVQEKIVEKVVIKEKIKTIQASTVCMTGLSPHAGASFITHMLADALVAYKLKPSIIEPPSERPYFYEALRVIEKENSFMDVFEQMQKKELKRLNDDQNTLDDVLYLVPSKHSFTLKLDDYMELLFLSDAAVNLIDVSSEETKTNPLFLKAKKILVVIDCLPIQVIRYRERLKEYLSLKDEGYPIEFIINHVPKTCEKEELLKILQVEPLAWIPHFQREKVYKLSVEGCSAYKDEQVRTVLEKSIYRILSSFIDKEILDTNSPKRRFSFKNFFKRKH